MISVSWQTWKDCKSQKYHICSTISFIIAFFLDSLWRIGFFYDFYEISSLQKLSTQVIFMYSSHCFWSLCLHSYVCFFFLSWSNIKGTFSEHLGMSEKSQKMKLNWSYKKEMMINTHWIQSEKGTWKHF